MMKSGSFAGFFVAKNAVPTLVAVFLIPFKKNNFFIKNFVNFLKGFWSSDQDHRGTQRRAHTSFNRWFCFCNHWVVGGEIPATGGVNEPSDNEPFRVPINSGVFPFVVVEELGTIWLRICIFSCVGKPRSELATSANIRRFNSVICARTKLSFCSCTAVS